MNCKQVQKLILTDYLDEQLNSEQKREIEAHIAGCQQCHQFENAAKKFVVEPFKRLERAFPREEVWHKIKREIETEKQQLSVAGLIERIKGVFLLPRNVFALITVVVAIVTIFVMFVPLQRNNQEVLTVNTEKQIENLAFLADGIDYYSSETEDVSYGTTIEEYFL